MEKLVTYQLLSLLLCIPCEFPKHLASNSAGVEMISFTGGRQIYLSLCQKYLHSSEYFTLIRCSWMCISEYRGQSNINNRKQSYQATVMQYLICARACCKCLITLTILGGRYCYLPHLTDEEPKAQKGQAACLDL